MLGGLAAIPPATVYNYLSFGVVGFIFQRVVRNKYPGWWSQYVSPSPIHLRSQNMFLLMKAVRIISHLPLSPLG
jgi:hypothetical protein